MEVGGVQEPNQAATGEQAKQPTERLNAAVQQQLNLESVKTRALGLYSAISRILEHIDIHARSNSLPKWQETLGQFSMVNMELFNIVEDIKKVSKPFVVYPKNVNGENANILPVMLSSKLLPEMEIEENSKRDQILYGLTNLPINTQIEKLKARIDMISAACDTAEKVLADSRKQYGLGSRQGPSLVPTLDKVQSAKIQEQENLLRAAVNFGEGLRIPADQRQPPSSLPSHLVDVLNFGDSAQIHGVENSGMYQKSPSPFPSGNVNPQGSSMQSAGQQLIGRSVQSPSSGLPSFDNNASTPPLPFSNSPRSGTNMVNNTPSPQQQAQHQQQVQRQKLMQQIPQQQQLRQPTSGMLSQNTMSQLHDLQSQSQPKFQSVPNPHQMQYNQPISQQQYQNRHLQSAMQLNLAQNQLTQGNQLRNMGQFTGSAANSALFNAAQSSPNPQMITNMSATMQSQSLLPRMQQYGLAGGLHQRNNPSQMLNDQIYGMGSSNQASLLAMQQQQQGGFGNMNPGAQSLQSNMMGLPNTAQNMGLPNTAQNSNFPQQRQQNQQ